MFSYRSQDFKDSRSSQPLDDIPAEEVTDLAPMAALSDASLWREAKQEMAAEERAELQDLLDS
jgi:hypothetical protein